MKKFVGTNNTTKKPQDQRFGAHNYCDDRDGTHFDDDYGDGVVDSTDIGAGNFG